MIRRWRPIATALAAALLATGCASVPRDAGVGEVKRMVAEHGGQSLTWDPAQPIEPPSSEALRPFLAGDLTVERAVDIAFANNRDLLATLEELGVARADQPPAARPYQPTRRLTDFR